MYDVGALNLGCESLREMGISGGQGQKLPCSVGIGVVQSKKQKQGSQRKEKSKRQSIF